MKLLSRTTAIHGVRAAGAAALAAALLLLTGACGRAPERPNILLITLDTTRRAHLSCYGYERETSPNLDALAREGVVYTDCISVSSWTLPSHASLFTGLYPAIHGAHYDENADLALGMALGKPKGVRSISDEFRANGLGMEAVTLAEVLNEEGYATCGVGSGPWLKPIFGLAQGFDHYDADCKAYNGRTADEVNALAIPFLKRQSEKPFFLFLNYFDPHVPFLPPDRLKRRFWQKPVPDQSDGGYDREYNISQYDAEILFMDEQIGAIFRELKWLERWDDTWIIVTGDHGEHLGEKGLYGHGYALFEETMRLPLIMKPPKGWKLEGDPGERVQLVHLMPTILERLGIDAPARCDAPPIGKTNGMAVAELYRNTGHVLQNERGQGQRFDRDLKAIYKDGFKLILSTRKDDGDAGLFDLRSDPGESRDLSPSEPQRAAGLLRALESWRRSLGDPLDPLEIRDVDRATRDQLKALGY
jgi:arylsulfatase A-like enzyme